MFNLINNKTNRIRIFYLLECNMIYLIIMLEGIEKLCVCVDTAFGEKICQHNLDFKNVIVL